jgi:hypothetical protein
MDEEKKCNCSQCRGIRAIQLNKQRQMVSVFTADQRADKQKEEMKIAHNK